MATEDFKANTPAGKVDNVPPVPDDIPATPNYIKYCAAVFLGLTFGVACYVLGNSIVGERPEQPKQAAVATYDYFNQDGAYYDPANKGVLPDPFISPFEPTLDANYTETGAFLREAADAESVEPVAPGDFSVSDPAQR